MISVLQKKNRMQSRKSQGHEVGGHSAKDQKQIQTSSWWTNHPGSVHTMFYSRIILNNTVNHLVENEAYLRGVGVGGGGGGLILNLR